MIPLKLFIQFRILVFGILFISEVKSMEKQEGLNETLDKLIDQVNPKSINTTSITSKANSTEDDLKVVHSPGSNDTATQENKNGNKTIAPEETKPEGQNNTSTTTSPSDNTDDHSDSFRSPQQNQTQSKEENTMIKTMAQPDYSTTTSKPTQTEGTKTEYSFEIEEVPPEPTVDDVLRHASSGSENNQYENAFQTSTASESTKGVTLDYKTTSPNYYGWGNTQPFSLLHDKTDQLLELLSLARSFHGNRNSSMGLEHSSRTGKLFSMNDHTTAHNVIQNGTKNIAFEQKKDESVPVVLRSINELLRSVLDENHNTNAINSVVPIQTAQGRSGMDGDYDEPANWPMNNKGDTHPDPSFRSEYAVANPTGERNFPPRFMPNTYIHRSPFNNYPNLPISLMTGLQTYFTPRVIRNFHLRPRLFQRQFRNYLLRRAAYNNFLYY